jgi:NADPH2:quinone reductase
MIGMICRRVGEDPELVEAELPRPEVAPGQILVKVEAIGVNFVDVLLRRDEYAQMPTLPFVPGGEIVGEVVEVGEGAAEIVLGERVVALTDGTGGYAELALADASQAFPLPASVPSDVAAGFLLTFLTVHVPLVRQLHLEPGATAIVHAAGGGVGTAALQLLRRRGIRTLATAGSDAKRDLARELGAEAAFDYRDEALIEKVREATGGRGVDLVVDPVGGDLTPVNIALLAPLGTVLMLGYAGGPWPPVDPALLVGRNVGICGFYLGRLMKLAPAVVRAAAEELMAMLAAGEVTPVIGPRLPLAEASRALDLLESRQVSGKAILLVGAEQG